MNRKQLCAIALAIALPSSALPSPASAQYQALPAAVAACSANPAICAVAVTAGGWLLYYRNHAPLLCTWDGCQVQRMMQDAESQNDDGIEVVASSKTHADRLCAERAANLSDRNTVVTCLGCRMRTQTTGKFICTLRTEHR